MSNKITSYYLPNKAANSFIASKRNETGEYAYDSALQDVGIESQAAIQSLNKTYSNVINDAYTNYLNSKRSIMSSNLGQGYKEAYIANQQEALQETTAQASLSAAETKQQILQQAYEQQNAIGASFQNEVINMEKVGDYLSKYMEDLKNVTNKNGSYYDAIIAGKGLTDYKGEITAEDLYDELYNAKPKGYKYEDDKEALRWTDWLKTQIKTDKEQDWYDWYMGAGGYEQFQDAYKKGIYGGEASKYLADQEAEQKKLAEEQQKEYDKSVTRYKNREAANAELSKIEVPGYTKHDGWAGVSSAETTKAVSKWLDQNANSLQAYATSLKLSDEEIKKALGGKTIRDYVEDGKLAYWKTDRWGNKYELDYRGLPGERQKEYNNIANLLKEYAIKKSIGEV
jgi:hypothetical protein